MLKFRVNPLWCCSVMPDGEMSAKAGGYTDFMGAGGTTGVMSNLEAFAKAHNYTNPEDPLASDSFSIAPILSQMKDSWENTTKGQQRDVSTKLMYSFLGDVITGFGLVSTATKIGAANRAINKAKSDMSKIIGEDLANEAWEAAFKGFNAEHATDISPEGKLSDQDFKKLLTGVYGFDPSTATQEQKDRYMVEQYYKSKSPDMTGKDFDDWVDQEVQNIQGGKYRLNRSQEMGVPEWYKQYLRHGPGTTIPQANDQTIPGGVLDNADPTIMGEGNMTDEEKLIRDEYRIQFSRDNPDQTGIDHWLGVLNDPDSGVTVDNLAEKMKIAAKEWDLNDAGSIWTNKNTGDNVYNEAKEPVTSGDVDSGLGADDSQTNEERLIRGFYQDLFGRSNPDAEGLKYWTDMLNNGVSGDDVRAKMKDAGGAWTPQGDGNWLRDDGLPAKDDMPTDYQYDIDNPQIFKDYVNSFYDSALQEYQNQSEQYQKATDEYKDTSSRLLGDQQDMLTGLTGRLDGSVSDYRDETGGYLDRLLGAIDDTKSSNLPRVNRLAGGQEVSYIPGSLRAANNDDRTAELELFDRSKGVSDSLLSTQTGNAGTIWDAGDATVNTGLTEGRQIYGNDMVMADQGNATLNYLDALRQIVGDERALNDSTANRIAAEQGNQFNYDRLASQEAAAEPGMLEYVKGIGTTASTVKDIYDIFSSWGG